MREGDHLVVIVADPPDPILPLRARAELVAGLAAVCSVIEGGSDTDALLIGLSPDSIIDDRSLEQETRRRLMAHVADRHQR